MIAEFAHQRRIYQVILPPLGQVLSLWMSSALRTAAIDAVLDAAEIRRFVQRGDASPVDATFARAVRDDPASWQAYRNARNEALAAATHASTVRALCPGCLGWEAELSPLALAVALRAPYWPLVDESDRLAVPALAMGRVDRELRGIRPAARLTVSLPGDARRSVALGPCAEAGWGEASQQLFRRTEQTSDWTQDSPGWAALLRLAALTSDATAPRTTEALLALTEIPLAEFLAVDQCYALTHVVSVPEDNSAALECRRCAVRFGALAPALT